MKKAAEIVEKIKAQRLKIQSAVSDIDHANSRIRILEKELLNEIQKERKGGASGK